MIVMKTYHEKWLGYMGLYFLFAFVNNAVIGDVSRNTDLAILSFWGQVFEQLCFTMGWLSYGIGYGRETAYKDRMRDE